MADHPAHVLHEGTEHGPLPGAKLDLGTRPCYLRPVQVHFKIVAVVGPHHLDRIAGGGAAEYGPYPSQQLFYAEGLGQIVVGPQVQGLQLRIGLFFAADHHDRNSGQPSDAAHQFHAAHPRQ